MDLLFLRSKQPGTEYEESCRYHPVLSGWDGFRYMQPPMYHLREKTASGWGPPLESFGKNIWFNPSETALCSSSCACRQHNLSPLFTVIKGPRLYVKLFFHFYDYSRKFPDWLPLATSIEYSVRVAPWGNRELIYPDCIDVLPLLQNQSCLEKSTQYMRLDPWLQDLLVHGLLEDVQLFKRFDLGLLRELGYLEQTTFKKFQQESSNADLHALQQFLESETDMLDEEDDMLALDALRAWLSPEDYKERVERLERMWIDLYWHIQGLRPKQKHDRELSRNRRRVPRLYWPLPDQQFPSSYTSPSAQLDGLVLMTKRCMRRVFIREHERVLHAVQRLHPAEDVDWETEVPSNWSKASRKGFRAMHAILDGFPPHGVGEILMIITLAMTIRWTLAFTDPSSLKALSEEELCKDISRWQICFRDEPSALQAYRVAVKGIWGYALDEVLNTDECDAGSLHLFQDMVSLLISEGKEMTSYSSECPEKHWHSLLSVQKRKQEAEIARNSPLNPPHDSPPLHSYGSGNVTSDDNESVPIGPIEQPEVKRLRGIVKDDPQLILVSWLMMGAIVACVVAGLLLARSISYNLTISQVANNALCDKRSLVWAARHLCWIMKVNFSKDSDINLGNTEFLIQNDTIIDFPGLVQYLSLCSNVSSREEITAQLMKWRASYTAQFCYGLVETYLGYKTAHNIVPRRQEPMKLSEYDAHLDNNRSTKPATSDTTNDQNIFLSESLDGSAASSRPPSRQPKQCNICKKWFKGGTPALGKHKRNQQCQKPKEEREKYPCVQGCEKSYLSRYDLEEHQRKDHGWSKQKRKYEKTGLADLNCF